MIIGYKPCEQEVNLTGKLESDSSKMFISITNTELMYSVDNCNDINTFKNCFIDYISREFDKAVLNSLSVAGQYDSILNKYY